MEPPQKKRKIADNQISINSLSDCPIDQIIELQYKLMSLLTKCDLTTKKLTEGLAVSVSKCSRLSELSISNYSEKKMDEEFLLHLTALTQLRKLQLFGNRIQVDDIEDLFRHLSNLQQLHEWLLFDHLTNLKQLTLQDCIEPAGFYVLENLEALVLDDNIMQEIDDYSELNSLTKLTRLKQYDLQDGYIQKISSLYELCVNFNSRDLTKRAIDVVCASMPNLTKLEWMSDSPDEEQSSLLANITSLHNLQYLLMIGPSPDSADIIYLAHLSNLTYLDWSAPNNEVAEQILKLTSLKTLWLSGNFDYTNEYFSSAMPNVRDLNVHGKNSPPMNIQ